MVSTSRISTVGRVTAPVNPLVAILRHGALLGIAVATIALLTACGKVSAETCTEPSEKCTCSSAADHGNDRRVVVLAVGSTDTLAEVLRDLRDADGDLPALGIDGDPFVVVGSANRDGGMDVAFRYDLHGEGGSKGEIDDNAAFQGACLVAAADTLPAPPRPVDLLSAFPVAIDEANEGRPATAAVLLVGFGSSQVRGQPPTAEWDLETSEARNHVMAILQDLGLVPTTELPVVFVDPGDGLEPRAADDLATFLREDLCPAIGPGCVVTRTIR